MCCNLGRSSGQLYRKKRYLGPGSWKASVQEKCSDLSKGWQQKEWRELTGQVGNKREHSKMTLFS